MAAHATAVALDGPCASANTVRPCVAPMNPHNLRLVQDAAEQLRLALQLPSHSMHDALDMYERERVTHPPLARATVAWQRRALSRLRAAIPGDRAVAGPYRDVAVQLYQDHPAPTASLACQVLVGVLRHAERRGWRTGPHEIGALAQVKATPRERFLTLDELARWANAVDAMRVDWQRYGSSVDALLCVGLTGARVTGVCEWTWTGIDADFGYAATTSKGKYMHVPLCSHAGSILRRRAEQRRHPLLVFPGMRNKAPIRSEAIGVAMREACKRAGIEGAVVHTLRHTLASQELRLGIHSELTRKMLGHSVQWMTSRYQHVLQPEVRDAAERYASAWMGGRRG